MIATSAPSFESGAADLPSLPPQAEELAILDELIEWVDCGARPGAPCSSDTALPQAIRARSASFDLFRLYHDDRSKVLHLESIPYGDAIRDAAVRHGLDALLVAAVVEAESRFDPSAVSNRGAIGLMQVLPVNVNVDVPEERLREPEFNLDAGSAYLRQMLDLYGGDLELALAAYNAGPANVRRYDGVPPFEQTRNYVQKVLGLYIGHHQQLWREGQAETASLL
ncbi:MAG: lytic transglycosylase domain-containing protein [Thermoanaerobaculia bacterium]|nr:lytic transglycosylase domain-containing protein [Thermoanaerobaculia bacterium]